MEGAVNVDPFFWENQKCEAGILLVHGYTANPNELRVLGEFLYKNGYTVCGVKLAGHGTTAEEMRSTNWIDWYGSVELGYQFLKGKAKNIYGVGISLGGLLLLHLAANFPLQKLITIGSPIWVGNKQAYLTKLFVPITDLLGIKLGYKLEKLDKNGEKYNYENNPIRCVYQLLRLINQVKKDLSKIQVPTYIMHSAKDTVAEPKSANYIYQQLGSKEKKIDFIGEEHVFVREHNKEAFEKILAFLKN